MLPLHLRTLVGWSPCLRPGTLMPPSVLAPGHVAVLGADDHGRAAICRKENSASDLDR
jgi:hypothetical protein